MMRTNIFLLYTILTAFYIFVSLFQGREHAKYCGTIKYKIDATRFGKHASYADPLFVVQSDNYTFEAHPSWDEYMSLKEGDLVCYEMWRYKIEDVSMFSSDGYLRSLITLGVWCVVSLVFLSTRSDNK